jgi:hypothetical protein
LALPRFFYSIQLTSEYLVLKIIRELIMKKKKNAILKAQIEQYEKLLNEVSKEDE